MAMYVYCASVDLSPTLRSVTKSVIRFRVVKTGRKNLTLTAWPQNYGDNDTVVVSAEKCYTNVDDARREADARAAKLTEVLLARISELEEPAAVIDRISEFATVPT